MPIRWPRIGLAAALAVALSACAIASVERPDSAAIPTGPLQALGEDATGKIVKLGEGQTSGINDVG